MALGLYDCLVYPQDHSTIAEVLLSIPLSEVLAKRFLVLLRSESHSPNYSGVPLQNESWLYGLRLLPSSFVPSAAGHTKLAFCIIVSMVLF